MLSSEFITIENPLPPDTAVTGIYLLNHNLFIFGESNWVKFDMRGNKEEEYSSPIDKANVPILRKYKQQ